jgi:predicted dithiol-disulfide oxidoreductase (DUF899 family)
MRDLQQAVEPEPVDNYEFVTNDGAVRLSQLFGDKDTLITIHNMGTSCPACTMWADGYNGLVPHLQSRVAFVMTTPDDPQTQADFARSRGWGFRMVSHQGSDFALDMGYRNPDTLGWRPGISVFRKKDGRIVRVSDQQLGPGDDFCSVYHFLDMVPEGWADFRPRFTYARSVIARSRRRRGNLGPSTHPDRDCFSPGFRRGRNDDRLKAGYSDDLGTGPG